MTLRPPSFPNGLWARTSGFGETLQVSQAKSILHTVYAINKNAAKVYLWIFNSAAGSTSGNPLIPPLTLTADDGYVSLDIQYGVPFSSGIYIAASSTLATFTALAANDVSILAGYSLDSHGTAS